ncbi:MAG TPA: class F sortase [Gemmataceae bacterium]
MTGRGRLAVAAAGLAAAAAGAALLALPPVLPPEDAGTVPAGGQPARRDPGRPAPEAGIPVLLRLDGQAAPVVQAGVGGDGALALPRSPRLVAWWAGGAWAGAREGTTVLAGHVDVAGEPPGLLARLPELPLGTPLVLRDDRGTDHRYVLVARRSYPKQDLPRELFRPDGPPRLVLITCGGRFDEATRQYERNVVGYAVPAS